MQPMLMLFHGATFGDLLRRDHGPLAIISAAELSTGARFDFLQESFDRLCGDLSQFPLARAVAASSSVPFLFSPITLWNRAGDCGRPFELRDMLTADERAAMEGTRLERRLSEGERFANRKAMPFLHLVDGGVANNLALRGLLDLDGLARLSPIRIFSNASVQGVRRVLVITVDAGNESRSTIAGSADVPTVFQVAEAMSDVVINRYSDETRQLVSELFRNWRSTQGAGAQVDIHIAPVSLRLVSDPTLRGELLALPTTLYLPLPQVQRLRTVAAELLRQSPDFQRLVRDIGTVSSPVPELSVPSNWQ